MSERAPTLALLAGIAVALGGCGQKGPLYLPDQPGEIVTRPTQSAPPPGGSEAPNTPQTVDSPQGPDNPAPEVTAPEETPDEKKPDDQSPPR
jgi:predicted small lipoprotein YifL